jgi:hypothetical protein
MRKIYYQTVFPAVLLLSSCLSPYSGSSEEGLPGSNTPIEIANDLFNESNPEFPGRFYFYTNDPKYKTTYGYTLWTNLDGSAETDVLGTREVIVNKQYGYAFAGYGITLCNASREVDGVSKPAMLTVMMNNNGQYAVGKVIDGYYHSLVWWTNAAELHKGSGLNNAITVTYADNNRYDLFFNATKVTTFTDENAPLCEGKGKNGYVVVIAPTDLSGAGVAVSNT